ncbi:glucosamine-6-phosphate deaminase [Larkinella rosea]|uniref:Glucosamine-6-phosphate deaminase n=1 Tax=Larkinella rosea TaxID=2025312 RepID=A0A3P1BJ70_9BACT|nr:glucosamine-6-phosphate deaminase [Larkinella rosea]RRB01088.1 glucosamine-6-phosphate deaminase [Larkinella rosea]
MKQFQQDLLSVSIFQNRQKLGKAAATEIAAAIHRLLRDKESINMVFGAAPSQDETLLALAQDPSIDWSRIRAFHMDEYVGLSPDAPQLFSRYLKEHLFDKIPLGQMFLINGNARDLNQECERYAALLKEFPTDIVCLGIGENTHIAFNDPHVADFHDKRLVKVVELDLPCRRQQVNDGCFPELEAVPRQAITLTVPALFQADYAFCMVPGPRKAQAVFLTLTTPEITSQYPASILREHPDAALFLDADSASQILKVYEVSGF